MGYSLYIEDTNILKNRQACLSDHNKYPMGYLKYTSLAEYLRKAINLQRRLVPNSEFLKDEEALADILGENFNKVFRRSQQRKDNIFGQEKILVSIAWQGTVINILPLIGLTL